MEFYVTFGHGQYDGKYKHSYFVINAESERAAKEEAKTLFKDSWSMLHRTKEAAGVDKFNLKEVQT